MKDLRSLAFMLLLLILSMAESKAQNFTLTKLQEDSVLQYINDIMHRYPDDDGKKHRTSFIQNKHLFLGYTSEDKKGRLDEYHLVIINLSDTYFSYNFIGSVKANTGCIYRDKYYKPKGNAEYNENIFSDTSLFKPAYSYCKEISFDYEPLKTYKNDFAKKDEQNLIRLFRFLMEANGGNKKINKSLEALDKKKEYLGFELAADRQTMQQYFLPEKSIKLSGFTWEIVDTSKSTRFRGFFGVRVRQIMLGFNEENKLTSIVVDYFNKDPRANGLQSNIEKVLGEPTGKSGSSVDKEIYKWEGAVRKIYYHYTVAAAFDDDDSIPIHRILIE